MPLWLIPMVYTVASLLAGAVLPRVEHAYFAAYTHGMSVASGMAFFSAVSSGMMALTGIVFAIAFVMVQFSALAYSPRLVIMFASNPALYHSLGIFFATFTYSLVALIWTDRGGAGTVPLLLVPAGHDPAHRQHAGICPVDPERQRPADPQCAAGHRIARPDGHSRDVSARRQADCGRPNVKPRYPPIWARSRRRSPIPASRV